MSGTIYSMTGFAAMQGHAAEGTGFALTIKGVNHRFLDLSMRLPANSDALEAGLRRTVKETVRRGHVDLTVQLMRAEAVAQLQVNHELVAAHIALVREAAARHGVAAEPELNAILRLPGVLRTEVSVAAADPVALEAAVMAAMPELLERFQAARAQEGASLAEEMRAAMGRIAGFAAEVRALRSGVRAAMAERLRVRMAELLGGVAVAEERILAEAALLAERSDFDEELVRLETHTARFLLLLDGGGELGKRLDFLLQELNREANTLLSKTGGAAAGNGLRVTELGLEMKLEIERVREQVQNLE